MVENIVATLHICGYIAILLLFYDHQDTELEQLEMEISVYKPILTQKKHRLWGTRIFIHDNMGYL